MYTYIYIYICLHTCLYEVSKKRLRPGILQRYASSEQFKKPRVICWTPLNVRSCKGALTDKANIISSTSEFSIVYWLTKVSTTHNKQHTHTHTGEPCFCWIMIYNRVNKRLSESVSEWVGKWVSKWVSGWCGKYLTHKVATRQLTMTWMWLVMRSHWRCYQAYIMWM